MKRDEEREEEMKRDEEEMKKIFFFFFFWKILKIFSRSVDGENEQMKKMKRRGER